MLDDAASAVKNINQEVALAQKTLKGVIDGGVADEQGQQLLDKVPAWRRITSRGSTRC